MSGERNIFTDRPFESCYSLSYTLHSTPKLQPFATTYPFVYAFYLSSNCIKFTSYHNTQTTRPIPCYLVNLLYYHSVTITLNHANFVFVTPILRWF